MIRESFNDGWEFRPRVSPFAELGGASVPYRRVTLPHDAMIGQERAAPDGRAVGDGGASGYFPGGAFEYRKTFPVPEDYRGRRIFVEFEGVYRDAMVYVNGDYAGQRPYGYSLFRIDAGRFLRFGQDNEIRVEARANQDSRWYTGAGIYRDTWLLAGGPVRIGTDGVRVTTPDIDSERAVVEVATRVENDSIAIRTVGIVTEIRDAAGSVVASDRSQVSLLPGEPATVRQRLYVRRPALWGPESPALYGVRVTLTDEHGEIDAETVIFGIRSLRLDPERGLRINGETVKLRGACVHHDNGVLGAATFPRAEERRVQILKDAGFNAIRMSHHPMSKAMLDACDRLGVLVMDEAFDLWTSAKSDFDYSLNFPQWWERDIEAMVAKDVNHPSVVLYSIGNEIPETGSPAGAAWGRKLAEKVRALDSTRYVTNAVNGMVAVIGDLAAIQSQAREGAGVNAVMADASEMLNAISSSDLVTRRTAESLSVLDIAGINYAEARYSLDKDLFPNRITVGSETFPTRIDGNWRLVSSTPTSSATSPGRAGTTWARPASAVRSTRPRTARGPPSPDRTRTCWRIAATSTSPVTVGQPPTTGRSYSACAPSPTWRSSGRSTTARRSPAARGRGATPSPAGPGPGSKARRSPSRSTATPTRWNFSSTAAPWAARRPATATGSERSSRRSTSQANCSPSPTPAAWKPAATPCSQPTARSCSAPRPIDSSSPRTAATSPTSPSPSPTWLAPAAPGPTGWCGPRSAAKASCSASAAPTPRPRSDSTRPSAAPTTDGPSPSCGLPAPARSG